MTNFRKANKNFYASWKVLRQNNKGEIVERWDSFEAFVADLGERPSVNHILSRKDKASPWGPDNFYWRELTKIPGEKFNMKEYLKKYKPTYDRQRRYMMKYGINLEQYATMVEEQKGLCYTCGKPESQAQQGTVRQLAVDHDHATGKVRKLLCNNCNAILGHARDSVNTLEAMIAYLKEHQ